MYNYYRDVYQAEHERAQAMRTAAERSVPYHLRSNTGKLVRQWFATNVWQPAGKLLGTMARVISYHGGRYWRRASSRGIGLVSNIIGEIAEHIPDRA